MIVVRADGKLGCINTMDLGFPIGLVEEIGEFIAQAEVQLNSGDVVVLYTDGIPEAFDINKAQYGLLVTRLCLVTHIRSLCLHSLGRGRASGHRFPGRAWEPVNAYPEALPP